MDEKNNDQTLMEKIVSLCKRRGFVFPGSELYGGLNGTWDLGPLGFALAQNIKNEWLRNVVYSREDVVVIDSSIIYNAKVWEASGHISSFTDPLVECKVCHERFRVDQRDQVQAHEKTHDKPDWTDVKPFNLMFKTHVGPLEDKGSETYLRPETAQGIFINFSNILDTARPKIPFGIAQIGKGFRNEITTGNFLFRVREFEMMELEYFVKPQDAEKSHKAWCDERLKWYLDLGIKKENIKLHDLPKEDLAHYSKGTAEIWYKWPFGVAQGKPGWGELEGIANRGDYDLVQHSKYSGKELVYFDEETREKYMPYVIEPSVGIGRAVLAFLVDAYEEDEKRVILKLHPKLAPYKAAVFPLVANKLPIAKLAKSIYSNLRKEFPGQIAYDDRGNIGKRYYSQDEIGTPYCITVDYQSLEDNTVTIRDRDTAKQERISAENLFEFIKKSLI